VYVLDIILQNVPKSIEAPYLILLLLSQQGVVQSLFQVNGCEAHQ